VLTKIVASRAKCSAADRDFQFDLDIIVAGLETRWAASRQWDGNDQP
jgi:hypothetical protein